MQKFGNPSYQKVAQEICNELTELEARSWDGKWRFEYEVAESKKTPTVGTPKFVIS